MQNSRTNLHDTKENNSILEYENIFDENHNKNTKLSSKFLRENQKLFKLVKNVRNLVN